MVKNPAKHDWESTNPGPGESSGDSLLDSPLGNIDNGVSGGEAESTECLGMRPGCFRQAKSFIRGSMDRDEQLDYLLHVQQCPDCRGYLDSAAIILLRRDRIREQLTGGGGR